MTKKTAVDEGQFVKSVAAALSPDGVVAAIRVQRFNGEVVNLPFPTVGAASFMLNMERAIGQLFADQQALLKGTDPRKFFQSSVRHVTKIQGGHDFGRLSGSVDCSDNRCKVGPWPGGNINS